MKQWMINLLAAFTIATGGVYLVNPLPAAATEVTCDDEDIGDGEEGCTCTGGGEVCIGDQCEADEDGCDSCTGHIDCFFDLQ